MPIDQIWYAKGHRSSLLWTYQINNWIRMLSTFSSQVGKFTSFPFFDSCQNGSNMGDFGSIFSHGVCI